MACREMLLFTQKCGKLHSTFELIYILNMLLVVSKYLIPRCSLIADRNVLFQSYTQYIKPDFIFSVCHSTFKVSNIVPNKSCNPQKDYFYIMYQVSLSRVVFEKLTKSYFRFIYRNDHAGHVATKINLELFI